MTDKAVSTEDLCIDVPRNASLEAARLEAVIKTLIENKVESLKNAKRKSSSITSSPKSLFNKLRGTSTSTVSSKDKDEIASIHSQISRKGEVERKRARRPPKTEHRKRKTSSTSPRRNRTSRSSKPLERTLQFSDEDGNENYGFLHREQRCASILDCSDPCCCRNNNTDMQIHVDDDFISLNIEDYDNLDPDELAAIRTVRKAQRKKRRRRKHHRKHLKMAAVAVQVNELKGLDDDELSQRARMTIVLTAFLLLFMCLLLVGITLRMAPLIDDMDDQLASFAKMSLDTPPLDFPEIDCLIDDIPAPSLRKDRTTSSLDDIPSSSTSRAPPRRHQHRHSCQINAFEPRRKSSSKSGSFEASRRKSRGSVMSSSSSRRHRTSSSATQRKWVSERQKARERKRRRTVYIVVGTFLFILFACVLVVIVTLTHQTEMGRTNGTTTYYTFAPPPEVVLEATAASAVGEGHVEYVIVRKENEELMNSFEESTSHDSLQNLTASVPVSSK